MATAALGAVFLLLYGLLQLWNVYTYPASQYTLRAFVVPISLLPQLLVGALAAMILAVVITDVLLKACDALTVARAVQRVQTQLQEETRKDKAASVPEAVDACMGEPASFYLLLFRWPVFRAYRWCNQTLAPLTVSSLHVAVTVVCLLYSRLHSRIVFGTVGRQLPT